MEKSARLYFPNESSEDPIVTGCVRKNGDTCEKTSDTTKRYFETEHGSEIAMLPDALNIKGGSKKTLSISFNDKVGVTSYKSKEIKLKCRWRNSNKNTKKSKNKCSKSRY